MSDSLAHSAATVGPRYGHEWNGNIETATLTTPRLLSPAAAAEGLGVSRRSVYRLADELKFFRLGDAPNAPLRVDSADLDMWIENAKQRARPPAPPLEPS